MLLAVLTAALFISKTKSSMLGQARLNTAQLYSSDLPENFEKSTFGTDEQVRRRIKAKGVNKLRARVAHSGAEPTAGIILKYSHNSAERAPQGSEANQEDGTNPSGDTGSQRSKRFWIKGSTPHNDQNIIVR